LPPKLAVHSRSRSIHGHVGISSPLRRLMAQHSL
jgi:hypothetical protein